MSNNTATNFSSRLRQRREQLGIRKHDLATSIGVSLTTIQQYENGQMPRGELAVRLSEVLDCSLDWLLAGREQDNLSYYSISSDRLIFVPTMSAHTSGNSLETIPLRQYAFRWDFLQQKGDPTSMVLLRITGDSMHPNIFNNDMVLIDKSQNSAMPGHMYAVSIEDMIYLKIIDTMPGKLILSCQNPAYMNIELNMFEQSHSPINILGKAVWVGRDIN